MAEIVKTLKVVRPENREINGLANTKKAFKVP
jgi:hypothetical protein